MDSRLTLVCMTAVAFLAGCATPQKPALPQAHYDHIATHWIGIQKCVESGDLTPESGAKGMRFIRSNLARYTFDNAQMSSLAQSHVDWKPTVEWCRSTAMEIAARDQQIGQARGNPQPQNDSDGGIKFNIPRQTYCNQVGTQTLCTTY